ncbi:MAG TPA: BamA/TamA family outer membrane protein [Candidatus Deferrimicrobium sp.]|nr:BamA/TamA family outer membrane protein [Candidatus Deferrimicrobium sp.]
MRRLVWAATSALLLAAWSTAASGADRTTLRWVRSKPPIDSIAITGNRSFETSVIKKRMYSRERSFWRAIKGDRRTRVQRETYGRDTLEIKYLYLSNGYLGIHVNEQFEVLGSDSAALVRVAIDEGRQFRCGPSNVTGAFDRRFASNLQKIAARSRLGDPVNLFDLHDAVFGMKTVLANEGYPYARVTFALDTSDLGIETPVTYAIDTDSLVTFGDIRIEGMERYPEKVARRELKIKTGHLYKRSDILDSQRRLVESGYFSTHHIGLADTAGDRLRPDFVLTVRERKPVFVTVKTGVGQSEVRDLTWDLSTGLGKRNFLGSRQYELLAQLSFGVGHDTRLLGHNYRIRFTEPWFVGVRMPLTLVGRYDPGVKDPVQNYRIEKWSVSASTTKSFGGEIKSSLGLEYQSVNIFGIPEQEVELKKEQERISVRRKVYFTFRRDSRDDLFIPHRGSVSDVSLQYYGGLLGGDDHFVKFEANWSSHQIVWPGWIWASRLRFGRAKEFGSSDAVPVNDRFYVGGANTVRGFIENSLGPVRTDGTKGADLTLVFNQEFRWRTLQVFRIIPILNDLLERFPLWQSIFFDMGNGFTHAGEISFGNLAYSYGTGVQLVSPAGPIRLDYARRIETDKIDFADRWHFTILYAF